MIHFTLIVIVVNPVQGAAAPVVQEQPIVQKQPTPLPIDPMRWHCPACGWWNTYDSMGGLKIGSKAHLRGCPKR